MDHDARFFARPLWAVVYLGLGLLLVTNAGADLFLPGAWWRKLLAVSVLAAGSWYLYLGWLARRRPIVALGEDVIENRPLGAMTSRRVDRRDVLGVAWSYPADIGLTMRGGTTAILGVVGLTPADRETVQRLIASGSLPPG